MKKRDSNFELMRIISMIMICMWHLVFHGGLYVQQGVTKYIIDFFVLFAAVHVPSYIILTGYFQYNKKFKIKNLINLICTVWFYKVIISSIFYFFKIVPMTRFEYFKELLPIDMRDYWYINCYLVLYIISPYINRLIENLKQKEFRNLLLIMFGLFSVIPLLTNNTTVNNNGYTVINFIFLYLIGAYLKKYPIKENYHFKIFSRNKKQIIFLLLTIIISIINLLLYNFSSQILRSNNEFIKYVGETFVINYRSFSNPLIIIQSISYFLYFETLQINSNFINKIAKNSLDVYLIHENYYFILTLYGVLNTSIWYSKFGTKTTLFMILVVPIVMYFVCIILSIIKDLIFKLIGKIKILRLTNNKIKKYIKEF